MPISAVCEDTTYLPNGPAVMDITITPPENALYANGSEWVPCKIVELLSMSSSAPSGYVGDQYYNTSTHHVYIKTETGWVSKGIAISMSFGTIYKLVGSNKLYCYADGSMGYVFEKCRLTKFIDGAYDDRETISIGGIENTISRTYEPVDERRVEIQAEYLYTRGSSTFQVHTAAESTQFKIYGRCGAFNPTTTTSGFKTYNLTTDVLSIDYTVDKIYGSILIPISDPLRWGFAWYIDRIYAGETTTYTLEDAVKYSMVNVSSSLYGFNRSSLIFRFIQAGLYNVRMKLSYRDRDLEVHNSNYQVISNISVYNPSKPAITLVSVTPGEYQSGNDDPLNGLPPYTVVWRDDSATADSHQIPQRNITINFGDSDSGVENMVFIDNPGSSLITAPQQTHVYRGYGAYVVSMTYTDKNGNSVTTNAQFAPSKIPRLIKSPTLTPLTGDQPLLVEGNAYVAGVPLPDVTWAYVLRGGNPDYYTGEKEGVFAQMSLLAGGTYDVTCEAKNEDTVIDTTAFEVVVDPQEIYPDAPVSMNNFDVAVYDSGGNLVDLMQPADHVKYVDRYNGGAGVSFRVPINYQFIERLTRYCVFDVGYLGKARRMIVAGFSESQDGTYVEIQGKDLISFVSAWRVATIATNSTTDNGVDLQICSGEALLRYWATANNEHGTLRQVNDIVVVGENQDRGDKCVYSARFGKISDTLTDICGSSGLGYESSLQESGEVGMKVVNGVDRDILFSDAKDGVRNAAISPYSSYEEPNVAIGAGSGEGPSRQYTDYGNTTAAGLSRREIFVDAGDSATPEEVEREALLQLLQNENGGLHITPTPDCPYKFSVDYFVGDYVMVRTKSGLILRLQITSAETSNYPGEGVITVLYCGADLRTQTKINREMQLSNLYAKK